jgi:hypothetical protein
VEEGPERAKGQRNLKTDLLEELGEVVQLKESGVAKKLTKQRALIKALTARGIGGDGRAANLILNLKLKLIEPEPDEPELSQSLTADDDALIKAFLARHSKPKGNQNV